MSKALIGIERDVALASIISEKTSLTILPLVLQGEKMESMTLKYTEYRILPQGILFFQKLPPQWQQNNVSRVQITFFYSGRGFYFASSLKRVQNGYALVVPQQVIEMTDSNSINENEVSAKVYYSGHSTVHAHCRVKEGFTLFENRLWLNFSKTEVADAEKYLEQIVGLKQVNLAPICMSLLERTKLILYIPNKKIPNRNYFPYAVTATSNDVETIESVDIELELQEATYDTYIPLAADPSEDVHSAFGMKTKLVVTTPIDIYETLLLLPVCRFFIQNNETENPVQGKAEALSILCITDSTIILGGMTTMEQVSQTDIQFSSDTFPLQQGLEYSLQLSIPFATLKRLIKVTMLASQVFKNGKGRVCVLCHFLNLQEEDRRFLYEKFNGALCK